MSTKPSHAASHERHTFTLGAEQVTLFIEAPYRVMATYRGKSRDTGLLASPPVLWPAVERMVREWITLKHPW